MAGEIKAIETNYRGCRFRSRLEARWAVFFDTLGWDWQYEKEGYVLGWRENDELPWLPDFEITTPKGQHFYVEVKGDTNFFEDGTWLGRLDFGGGPPSFPDCGWTINYDAEHKPILLLGDIPRFGSDRVEFYIPIIVHYKGVRGYLGKIRQEGLYPEEHYRWDNLDSGDGLEDFQVIPWRSDTPDYVVNGAMQAASSARFEHGEKPKGATK